MLALGPKWISPSSGYSLICIIEVLNLFDLWFAPNLASRHQGQQVRSASSLCSCLLSRVWALITPEGDGAHTSKDTQPWDTEKDPNCADNMCLSIAWSLQQKSILSWVIHFVSFSVDFATQAHFWTSKRTLWCNWRRFSVIQVLLDLRASVEDNWTSSRMTKVLNSG